MGATLMRVVIDASVAAAWCFPDEESDVSSRACAAVALDGGVVPFIFVYEICNILIVAERHRRIDATGISEFLARLGGVQMETDRDHNIDAIMTLAREHGLTGYDAAYLETAMRRNAPLATLDNALRAAAVAAGVDLV